MPEPLTPQEWDLWDLWNTAQRVVVQEADRALQRDHGISKAEFGVLVTLWRAPGPELRVGELADALRWNKGQVSHQLTRMEERGLVERREDGSAGRRTGVGLTTTGRRIATAAIAGHGELLRRLVFDVLDDDGAAAIRRWSRRVVERAGTPPE